MRQRLVMLGVVLLAALVLSGPAMGAETQTPAVPAAPPAMSEAPPAAAAPVTRVARPPAIAPGLVILAERAGLVVTRAVTIGQVKGELAALQMTLAVESYRKGEQRVPLFGADVAITEWSVKSGLFGPNAYLDRGAPGIELVTSDQGKFTVVLGLVAPVTPERLGKKLTVPVIRALAARTELTVEGQPDLAFEVTPAVSMAVEKTKVGTKVTLYGGEGAVTLSWQPKAPEMVLKPVVFAEQALRVRVGQGVMRLDSTIDYNIVQGKVGEFEIRFPSACNLLAVDGKDIRVWDITETQGVKTLKVTLLSEVEKQCTLSLSLEQPLPHLAMTVPLPAIEPLNVVRERGYVAVAAGKGLSVETETMTNVSHVDVRELPKPMLAAAAGLPAAAGDEVRLGFRYFDRPFELSLRTGEVVAKTSVQALTLVRTGLDSMRLTSTLNFTIRDAGVFGFRVGLDQGLKLVDINGANINNWQLDSDARVLTVALRSRAEGEYQLQIETELEKFAPEHAAVPGVHALGVDRESGYLAILPAPTVKVETAALTGISQIDVKELPEVLLSASPALGYRYIRPDYALAVKISEIEAEVQAEVRTIATLDEHDLSLATEIHYAIRRAGIFQLRVAIPKDLRRLPVEGEDIDDTSWDETQGILTVNLRAKVVGSYVLRLRTERTLKALEGGVDLPVITAIDAKKENGYVVVVPKASVRLKVAEGNLPAGRQAGMQGLEAIGVSDLPPEMVKQVGQDALPFKYFSQPWSLSLAVERIEPRVTAEVFNLLSVGEGLMTVSSTVKYTILHAGIDTFTIKVPVEATAVDLDGDGIKQRQEDKANHAWTVVLQSKRTGDFTLYVNFQIKLDKSQANIPYAGVETVNTQRETGYLAVTSRPDMELTVGEQDVESLTAIDAREIPADYMQGVTLPTLLAYRYVAHPYVLRITGTPHDAADVTVAVIESARLSTTVTREGNMITDLVCYLRNSRQQYLDLQLPEKARIWHAFVDGAPATPLRDGNLTKIPVARTEGRDAAFEVRLRYSDQLPGQGLGRLGSIKLNSPMKGIDIMRLGWTLSLPDGYSLLRDKGNIERLENIRAMEAQLQRLNPDTEVSGMVSSGLGVAGANRAVNVARQDMNPQWVNNAMAMEQAESTAPGKANVRRSIYTGAKPLEGRVFHFQSLIVSSREPAWVEVQYVKGSLGLPLGGVLVLLTAAGCGLVWRTRKWSPAVRFGVLAGAAVVVLAIRTLAEKAYSGYLETILITIVVVAGGLLVWTAIAWLRDVGRRWRAGRRLSSAAAGAAPQDKAEDKGSEETQI